MSWLLSDSVASAYTVLGFAPSPPNVKFFIREVFYSVPFMEDEELSFFILFFIIQILLPLSNQSSSCLKHASIWLLWFKVGEGEGRRREEQKLDLQVVVCINELLSLAPATESSGNHTTVQIVVTLNL